jgi:CRP/FNR family transcriptional regulator, cyclic AMP receptor protein
MDESASGHMEIFKFLKKIPFFSRLTKQALWQLSSIAQLRIFEKDEILIEENTPPVGIFIIVKGQADVYKMHSKKGELSINQLKEGDIIGEISVIDKLNTTASVKAYEELQCIFISEWDFTAQIHAYPEIGLELLQVLASRVRQLYQKLV